VTTIVSKDEVLKLAALSSLSLQEQEIPDVVKQLNDVLGYAVRVGQIAKDMPDTRVVQVNVFRQDVVGPSYGALILAAAPLQQEHYFVVPAVLEK
jgi:aspartyl/glutamyl-tRNA(Asn/Gln) amidotransferase C subunit